MELYLNKDVSRLTGLPPRKIIDWTQRGLVFPRKPAKKAGQRRGYDFQDLLQFKLAHCLLDIIGVQFFTCKTLLDELRADGEIEIWASDYSNYTLSFKNKEMTREREELVSSHFRSRVSDPRGLGGTFDHIPTNETSKGKADESFEGTLYYIIIEREKSLESIRIISPWNLSQTLEAFAYQDEEIEDILSASGMITVNLGRLKSGLKERIREA